MFYLFWEKTNYLSPFLDGDVAFFLILGGSSCQETNEAGGCLSNVCGVPYQWNSNSCIGGKKW